MIDSPSHTGARSRVAPRLALGAVVLLAFVVACGGGGLTGRYTNVSSGGLLRPWGSWSAFDFRSANQVDLIDNSGSAFASTYSMNGDRVTINIMSASFVFTKDSSGCLVEGGGGRFCRQ